MKVSVSLNNVNETLNLAFNLSKLLKPNQVITLNGNLGAGKTVFAKGLAKGLNIKQEITSPTFNILKCYFDGDLPFYHIDAYRLEDSLNKDIGLEEVIDGDGVCLIEWPIFIQEMIDSSLNINIEIVNENKRIFTFESSDEQYEEIFNFLRSC